MQCRAVMAHFHFGVVKKMRVKSAPISLTIFVLTGHEKGVE